MELFSKLLNATTFNPDASKFIQSIAGHKPDSDKVKLIRNLKHIQNEAQEGIDLLQKAIDEERELTQDETKGVRDAYADVRVLLDGACQMATFPFLNDYVAVLESLITRFDPSGELIGEDELFHARKTSLKYEELGVRTRIHKDEATGMYVNIVEDYHTLEAEQNPDYPVGKWLKSYRFSQPTLEDADVAK